ncbi:MAG TPA: hypothetical protein VFN97_26150 [Actinospica sp.]|nr:hypothetical protein [Actinospica sp.]
MTNTNQNPDSAAIHVVRLVAAGPHDVLRAVPLTNTRLPSLDTPKVTDWLAENKDAMIYVLPEADLPADLEGRSSLVAPVNPQEFDSLRALMPGA